MASDQVTHFHIMSLPSTNALMTLLTNAVRGNQKLMAAGFNIVYVGKDKAPLKIIVVVPIEGDSWNKFSLI